MPQGNRTFFLSLLAIIYEATMAMDRDAIVYWIASVAEACLTTTVEKKHRRQTLHEYFHPQVDPSLGLKVTTSPSRLLIQKLTTFPKGTLW
jgi:hypothetical protein